MAQRPSVVTAEVTSVPDPTEISRVGDFVREPFVEDGEDAAAVLAPGSIRRHAFEAARTELDAGAEVPSQKWRRRWSLLLGLDRTLNATTPVLADGTTLNPHQIDALSGTYAALLADAQRRASGGSGSDGDALLLSFEDEDPTELEEPPAQVTAEDDDEGHDDGHDDEGPSVDEDGDELESIDEQLVELPDAEPESESSLYDDLADEDVDEDIDRIALEDPNAHKRFWFEHATGAGKTVAAMGFVEACRTGGILILTHRRNLVDQFQDELRTRGYGERLSKPLLTDADGNDPNGAGGGGGNDILGPVTIETYQWFVRNAGRISGAYTVVICDEAHTALGDKTSAAIRAWTGPIFIGMTATGALIARHVADLFPTQTSRFDLAQAARRGVIAPLRCLRIPPGPGVRTIAKVPLRKGEVDMEFDQDELAKLLDQAPFNLAIADLYKTRFRNTPGVVYTAGVKHAYNVAESFRALGMKAMAVSGETPKRELATILAQYDAGEIDVLINAQLLAEGWNSPRATICMHLAPTASKRIYQQRVGRVTRRHPGKEAGVVIDFVHPATPNDDPVVTLHSLLDRDVYRGGAIVVGPVRRGRGRRVKVERRVLPVTPDIERRRQVFERELWRIAVEQLDWGEQRVWAALAGAKASPANWRRGRAMLNFDRSGELRRQFLITALERNRSPQLRMRAIQEIALLREAEPFDTAIDFIGQWPRDERREASRTMLQAMADRRIGRRDQATAWIWRLAEYTRDVHEEYAAQRWPATKHLLGLLVNSSGAAHARNARRLVHGARQHDRRLQAALLAAAVAHTPEAEEVLREARTRLARKPGALSRDLLKDFPNGKRRKKRTRKRRGGGGANGEDATTTVGTDGTTLDAETAEGTTANGGSEGNGNDGNGQNGNGQNGNGGSSRSRRGRSRGGRRRNRGGNGASAEATPQNEATPQSTDASVGTSAADEATPAPIRELSVPVASDDAPPARRRRVRGQKAAEAAEAARADTAEGSDDGARADASSDAVPTADAGAEPKPTARRTRTRTRKTAVERAAEAEAPAASVTEAAAAAPEAAAAPVEPAAGETPDAAPAEKPVRRTRTRKTAAQKAAEAAAAEVPAASEETPAAEAPVASAEAPAAAAEKPVRATRTRKTAAQKAAEAAAAEAPAASEETPAAKPAARRTTTRKTAAQKAAEAAEAEAPASAEAPVEKPVRATRTRKTAAQKAAEAAAAEAPVASEETPAAKPATRRTTTRKTAAQKAAEAAEAEAPVAAEKSPVAKPATRRTTTRKTAAQKAAEAAAAEAPAASEETPAAKPAARRTTTRKTAAQKAAEAAAAEVPAASEETPAAKPAARRTTTRKTAAQKAAEAAAAEAPAAPEEAPAAKPAARRTTTRKTAAQKAAEAAADGVDDAPVKKPAARRTTAAAKTTASPRTATATAAKKPAARKTAAQKAAEAAAETAADAPAKKPAVRKTTAAAAKTTTARKTTTAAARKPAAARTTAATKSTAAAAKKPAARKPAAAKTTAAKTTATRRKTTPKPEEA